MQGRQPQYEESKEVRTVFGFFNFYKCSLCIFSVLHVFLETIFLNYRKVEFVNHTLHLVFYE